MQNGEGRPNSYLLLQQDSLIISLTCLVGELVNFLPPSPYRKVGQFPTQNYIRVEQNPSFHHHTKNRSKDSCLSRSPSSLSRWSCNMAHSPKTDAIFGGIKCTNRPCLLGYKEKKCFACFRKIAGHVINAKIFHADKKI